MFLVQLFCVRVWVDLAPWRTETATKASMVVATRGERGSLLLVRQFQHLTTAAVWSSPTIFMILWPSQSQEDFIGWRWLKHVEAKSIKFVQGRPAFSAQEELCEGPQWAGHRGLGSCSAFKTARRAVPGSSWGAQVWETIIRTTSPFWWLKMIDLKDLKHIKILKPYLSVQNLGPGQHNQHTSRISVHSDSTPLQELAAVGVPVALASGWWFVHPGLTWKRRVRKTN